MAPKPTLDTKTASGSKKDGPKSSQRSQRSSRVEKKTKKKGDGDEVIHLAIAPVKEEVKQVVEESDGDGLSSEAAALLKEALTPRSNAAASSSLPPTPPPTLGVGQATPPPPLAVGQVQPMDLLDAGEVPKSFRASAAQAAEDADADTADRKSKPAPRLSHRASRTSLADVATAEATPTVNEEVAVEKGLENINESAEAEPAELVAALTAMLPAESTDHELRTTMVAKEDLEGE